MKGFVKNIEGLATHNREFRQVLYTAKNCQLVLMALKPHEEIGAEVFTNSISSFGWNKGTARQTSTGFAHRSALASPC